MKSKQYQKFVTALKKIRQKLPVTSLYTVKIEPVTGGELVLRKTPLSDKNPLYDGKDDAFAYRQVFVLDTGGASGEIFHPPGDEDFSESGEIKVYATRLPFVTPIYEAKATGNRYMTAFAPLLDKNENVIALVAADLSLEVIDKKALQTQGFIFVSALFSFLLLVAALVYIANYISAPVEELKNAALTLAAGNYGRHIEVRGPEEISELANTLNTLSECLREHMTRLEENSLLRERMIGEVECIRILEDKLVDIPAENFSHPVIRLKTVGIQGRTPHKTSVLEILENKKDKVAILFKEASLIGFEGISELVSGKETISFCRASLKKEKRHWKLRFQLNNSPEPLLWSTRQGALIPCTNRMDTVKGDYIIFMNPSLNELVRNGDTIQHWFVRVWRNFADQGLDACTTLLMNEFTFLAQRHELSAPLEAIILQIAPEE